MYAQSFAVVANDAYSPGLQALLSSIFAYHGNSIRTFVLAFPDSSGELGELVHQHPLEEALTVVDASSMTPKPFGCWEAKQQALAHLVGRARVVCLLDANLVLLSPIGDVFESAQSGKIVSCRDGISDCVFGDEYGVYSPELCGKRFPYFNSGFLCLDVERHWDLVGLWAFTARFGAYMPEGGDPLKLPGHGDQGLLNAIAATLNKRPYSQLFEQDNWCNSQGELPHRVVIQHREAAALTVQNLDTGELQRMLHSTGPKWWTAEGRMKFGEWGDFLPCFEHFASWKRKAVVS